MDDKIVFENRFISIIDREGYTFLHEKRANGEIIALVPFRHAVSDYQYLSRIETCPAHSNQPNRYSITGGMEQGNSIREMAVKELLEETGYSIVDDELIPLGQLRPTKSADTVIHLFTVDLSDKKQGNILGDGSRWENNASAEWLSFQTALDINDAVFLAGLLRLNAYLKEVKYGKS